MIDALSHFHFLSNIVHGLRHPISFLIELPHFPIANYDVLILIEIIFLYLCPVLFILRVILKSFLSHWIIHFRMP